MIPERSFPFQWYGGPPPEGNGDPDLPRADGWTPLYAALAGWHRHAAHLLLQRGARPDCPLPTERSPLLIAVLKGYPRRRGGPGGRLQPPPFMRSPSDL